MNALVGKHITLQFETFTKHNFMWLQSLIFGMAFMFMVAINHMLWLLMKQQFAHDKPWSTALLGNAYYAILWLYYYGLNFYVILCIIGDCCNRMLSLMSVLYRNTERRSETEDRMLRQHIYMRIRNLLDPR